ncbi:MAG: hypothetical protein KF746_25490 [Chitinophagaceae bacterium]|nr:hypothetical protein [Chitinophagaceae bacterium]
MAGEAILAEKEIVVLLCELLLPRQHILNLIQLHSGIAVTEKNTVIASRQIESKALRMMRGEAISTIKLALRLLHPPPNLFNLMRHVDGLAETGNNVNYYYN